jgi:hypothetical protein
MGYLSIQYTLVRSGGVGCRGKVVCVGCVGCLDGVSSNSLEPVVVAPLESSLKYQSTQSEIIYIRAIYDHAVNRVTGGTVCAR